MKNKLTKIYITGDSFSWLQEKEKSALWVNLLATRLQTEIDNYSCPGVSQDWIWNSIAGVSNVISSNDQLIVILTDPSRFWFIENAPDLSNSWIVDADFERIIGNPEVKKAIEYYVKYIQRPGLDIQFLAHRLGWLNNLVRLKNLRKPLVILAFSQIVPDPQNYPDLIFSKGDLTSVSKQEETPEDPHNWKGIDVRFNHLTLSNHKILVEKISDSIRSNTELDLTQGFNTKVLNSKSILDPEFVNSELSLHNVQLHNSVPDKPLKSLSRKLFNL